MVRALARHAGFWSVGRTVLPHPSFKSLPSSDPRLYRRSRHLAMSGILGTGWWSGVRYEGRACVDLRQLRYFSSVVESGSFSKAANQLRIAQPSLSQHVRRMEEELGVTLLHRGAHGVTATEAGDRAAAACQADSGRVRRDSRQRARRRDLAPRRGALRPAGYRQRDHRRPLIEAAMERYPDIRIRVVEAMTAISWTGSGAAMSTSR